ncbi:hypothetical protein Q8A67_010526 [Cirrhinus molitorella]|uniref:Ninjurin 1 n=1 Tax=Cirrhinus molitorella TaxID=172907 RepID=A0AA88PSZ2_9TELE|nr:hypothetical protein Q8A67_010526 [Cirrhinus molitorella]
MAADTIELNTGTGLQVSHGLGLPRAPLNMNHYANKKSAAESMLDVALLMANASQLKAVLEQGPQFTLYTSLITLISLSLCLQVLVGILLIFIVNALVDNASFISREHFHFVRPQLIYEERTALNELER